jgi:segregation and condensation protein B
MMEERMAILEALLFASEAPLTAERAADVLPDVQKREIVALLAELQREYETRGGGILLQEVAGGFQFRTRPEMAPWIRKLRAGRPAMLSPAALETLAVVAYRQPIVKAEVDRIRGVDASGTLKGLLEKKLVRIVGRKDVPGKPIIYGTTRKFLEVFNLKDLTELPTLREFRDMQDQQPVQQELPVWPDETAPPVRPDGAVALPSPPGPPEGEEPPAEPPAQQETQPESPEPQEGPETPMPPAEQPLPQASPGPAGQE